jgi:hypothetical protein
MSACADTMSSMPFRHLAAYAIPYAGKAQRVVQVHLRNLSEILTAVTILNVSAIPRQIARDTLLYMRPPDLLMM